MEQSIDAILEQKTAEAHNSVKLGLINSNINDLIDTPDEWHAYRNQILMLYNEYKSDSINIKRINELETEFVKLTAQFDLKKGEDYELFKKPIDLEDKVFIKAFNEITRYFAKSIYAEKEKLIKENLKKNNEQQEI